MMSFDAIRLLILDVDGVLTDGAVLFDAAGGVGKAFHIQDGCAIKLWQRSGGQAAIISGRESGAVDRRAAELGIGTVLQGVADKLAAYEDVLSRLKATDATTAYVGDDLPDVPPMRRCALPVAVADAVPAVKRVAGYVTSRLGGRGAIAEVVEWLLRKQGRWAENVETACPRESAGSKRPAPAKARGRNAETADGA